MGTVTSERDPSRHRRRVREERQPFWPELGQNRRDPGRQGWRSERRLGLVPQLIGCLIVVLWALAFARAASAQDDVAGYCDWVRGSADANRALLVAPELFARGALVQTAGDEQDPGDALTLDPGLRVTAGARYGFGGLHRAGALRDEAEALCARYKAEAGLRAYGDLDDQLGLAQALRAEVEVVDRALGDAQTLLSRVRDEVAAGTATDAQRHAMALRVERLRERRRAAEVKLAQLDGKPDAPSTAAFPELLARWREADRNAERARARGRLARAWDASVTVGYDEILGVERELPLVASAGLSLNLGVLWQSAANQRAADGLAAWREAGPNPAKERIDKTTGTLRRLRKVEAKRLEEVDVLLQDLRERKGLLEGIQGAIARRHREALWFTEMDLVADRAYLRARLAEIDAFLTGTDTTGTPKLRMTLGEVEPLKSGRFRITDSKARGVLDHSDGSRASLDFVYHGPSKATAKLGSGAVVRQVGLKLNAQDGCNLLYVMWREAPKPEIYVASKLNPGAKRHEECGNGGYQRLEAIRSEPVGTFDDGKGHRLSAVIAEGTLTVRLDGDVVWRGRVPAGALSLRGPAGFRTDNGEFEVALQAR